MIGLGLRQLREALDRKADEVQREFLSLSDSLAELNAELLELTGEAKAEQLAKIKVTKARQVAVAEEINTWRERARHVIQTRGGIHAGIPGRWPGELRKQERLAVQHRSSACAWKFAPAPNLVPAASCGEPSASGITSSNLNAFDLP